MKKFYFLFLLITPFFQSKAQELKSNQSGFKTIAFFSNKDVLGIQFNLIKLNDYYLLEVEVDKELDDQTESVRNSKLKIKYTVNTDVLFELEIESISEKFNTNGNKRLFILNEENIETLKKRKIKELEINFEILKNYTFKNIKEPNFFIDNLK